MLGHVAFFSKDDKDILVEDVERDAYYSCRRIKGTGSFRCRETNRRPLARAGGMSVHVLNQYLMYPTRNEHALSKRKNMWINKLGFINIQQCCKESRESFSELSKQFALFVPHAQGINKCRLKFREMLDSSTDLGWLLYAIYPIDYVPEGQPLGTKQTAAQSSSLMLLSMHSMARYHMDACSMNDFLNILDRLCRSPRIVSIMNVDEHSQKGLRMQNSKLFESFTPDDIVGSTIQSLSEASARGAVATLFNFFRYVSWALTDVSIIVKIIKNNTSFREAQTALKTFFQKGDGESPQLTFNVGGSPVTLREIKRAYDETRLKKSTHQEVGVVCELSDKDKQCILCELSENDKRTPWLQVLLGDPHPTAIQMKIAKTTNEITVCSKEGKALSKPFRFIDFGLDTLKTTSRQQNKIQKGSIRFGDVSDLMYEMAGKDSESHLFQAASQFNLLSISNPQNQPSLGVGVYEKCKTQGPAVAIAGGFATLYRNYGLDPQNPGSLSQHGQMHQQYNGLRNVIEWSQESMENGYLLPKTEQLQAYTFEKGKKMENLRVGVHPSVQLTSRRYGTLTVAKDERTVAQVFAYACPIARSGLSYSVWKEFSIDVLKYGYLLTMLAASTVEATGPTVHVWLTLLGLGNFGNSLTDVLDAIEWAYKKFCEMQNGIRISLNVNLYDEATLDAFSASEKERFYALFETAEIEKNEGPSATLSEIADIIQPYWDDYRRDPETLRAELEPCMKKIIEFCVVCDPEVTEKGYVKYPFYENMRMIMHFNCIIELFCLVCLKHLTKGLYYLDEQDRELSDDPNTERCKSNFSFHYSADDVRYFKKELKEIQIKDIFPALDQKIKLSFESFLDSFLDEMDILADDKANIKRDILEKDEPYWKEHFQKKSIYTMTSINLKILKSLEHLGRNVKYHAEGLGFLSYMFLVKRYSTDRSFGSCLTYSCLELYMMSRIRIHPMNIDVLIEQQSPGKHKYWTFTQDQLGVDLSHYATQCTLTGVSKQFRSLFKPPKRRLNLESEKKLLIMSLILPIFDATIAMLTNCFTIISNKSVKVLQQATNWTIKTLNDVSANYEKGQQQLITSYIQNKDMKLENNCMLVQIHAINNSYYQLSLNGDLKYCNLLHAACLKGDYKMMNFLCSLYGVKFELQNQNGNTCLHVLAMGFEYQSTQEKSTPEQRKGRLQAMRVFFERRPSQFTKIALMTNMRGERPVDCVEYDDWGELKNDVINIFLDALARRQGELGCFKLDRNEIRQLLIYAGNISKNFTKSIIYKGQSVILKKGGDEETVCEVDAMKKVCGHPNIVKMLGLWEDETEQALVTVIEELTPSYGGRGKNNLHLYSRLYCDQQRISTVEVFVGLAKGIGAALEHIHKKGICHGYLSLGTTAFVRKQNSLLFKLTDFGSSLPYKPEHSYDEERFRELIFNVLTWSEVRLNREHVKRIWLPHVYKKINNTKEFKGDNKVQVETPLAYDWMALDKIISYCSTCPEAELEKVAKAPCDWIESEINKFTVSEDKLLTIRINGVDTYFMDTNKAF